jgi:hypothetical protein
MTLHRTTRTALRPAAERLVCWQTPGDARLARLADLMPAFLGELEDLVRAAARPELAEQLCDLEVVARCTCGDAECAHFYTAEPPSGPYGREHSNLLLPALSGMIVLDLLGDVIVAVEALDRHDVKVVLDEHFGSSIE